MPRVEIDCRRRRPRPPRGFADIGRLVERDGLQVRHRLGMQTASELWTREWHQQGVFHPGWPSLRAGRKTQALAADTSMRSFRVLPSGYRRTRSTMQLRSRAVRCALRRSHLGVQLAPATGGAPARAVRLRRRRSYTCCHPPAAPACVGMSYTAVASALVFAATMAAVGSGVTFEEVVLDSGARFIFLAGVAVTAAAGVLLVAGARADSPNDSSPESTNESTLVLRS